MMRIEPELNYSSGTDAARDLTLAAVSNVFWTGLSIGTRTVLGFAQAAVLARLLTPQDFGLFTMALVVVEAAMLFGYGLDTAAIQRKDLNPRQLDSLFWVKTAIGLALMFVTIALAQPASHFFREPAIRDVLIVLSLGYLLDGLGQTHAMILLRGMHFRATASVEIGGSVVRLSTIGLVWLGLGVWSLVLGNLLVQASVLIARLILVRWHPHARFDWAEISDLFYFGLRLFGNGVLWYMSTRLDVMVVGRLLGTVNLGYYRYATTTSDYFRTWISGLLIRALFPAFSRIQDDKERFRQGYLRVIGCQSICCFPLALVLLVTAPEFIVVMLGAGWESVIVPFQVFCVEAMIGTVFGTSFLALSALGHADLVLKGTILRVAVMAPALVLGTQWGLAGAAAGVLTGSIAAVVPFRWTMRLLGIHTREVFAVLAPAASASAVMLGGILALRGLLAFAATVTVPLMMLSFCLTLGVLVYLVTLTMLWPSQARNLWALVSARELR